MSEKRVCIKPFNSENAAVKLKSNATGEIVSAISRELKRLAEKAGNFVTDEDSVEISIEGDVVMIDEGSRFMRYFIGPFGVGATKLEVEGKIKNRGMPVHDFHFKEKGLGGIGGGNSEDLLENSARRVARKINKLIQKMAFSS